MKEKHTAMKKLITTIFILLTFLNYSQAPNWVMNWGANVANPTGDAWDIEPDNFGNLYMSYRVREIQDMDFGAGTFTAGTTGIVSTYIARYTTAGTFKWGFHLSNSSTYWHKIEADKHGNFYLCGTFQSTVDFDPGPLTANLSSTVGTSVFVAKYDSTKKLKWVKNFPVTSAAGFQSFNSMKLDNNDKLYISLSYRGTVDLDPGVGSVLASSTGTTATDEAIVKLDSSGAYLWHRSITGQGYEVINDISIDYLNNRVNLAGTFQSTATIFTGTFASAGSYDAFVSSLNAVTGGSIFTKKFGGTSTDQSKNLETLGNGDILLHGEYFGAVDFDPGPGVTSFTATSAPADLFLSKFDMNGNLLWARNMSGLGIERNLDMDMDSQKYIWLSDFTSNCLDADPGVPVVSKCANVSGAGAMVMIKLDSLGNYITSFSISTPTVGTVVGAEAVNCSMVDNSIYLAGRFNGLTDFDPGVGTMNLSSICTSLNNTDAVFMKYPSCPTIPTVNVVTSNTMICVGETATLTPSGGNTYVWQSIGASSTIAVSPTVTTNYTVTGLNSEGCFSKFVFTQSVTVCSGLTTENDPFNTLKIYPNPTDGLLNIEVSQVNESTSIEVYNSLGQLVNKLDLISSLNTIDLKQLHSGIYFVKVLIENNCIVRKIIKE